MTQRHTDREYEQELRTLRERILLMAGRVERMIGESIRALEDHDAERARATVLLDNQVNQDELEIDGLCLSVLARRQPMASDLRFLTLALKMVTDLERIGDLAVNVAERVVDLTEGPPHSWKFVRTPKMAARVREMVSEAIEAFVHADADRARRVIEMDDEVDQLYHDVFQALLEEMRGDPSFLHPGIHIQSVAKFLERIGDHATNLAEQVIFMVAGKDVRHEGKLPRA
jgi:phosphate transport system protein